MKFFLLIRLIIWYKYLFIFLFFFYCLFRFIYSIYLYRFIQFGKIYNSNINLINRSLLNYSTLILHLLPLNLFIFNLFFYFGAASRKYANYWWNPMIAELRAQAHKALRKVTRERKKNTGNTEPLVNAYKEIRRQLKKEIACSKKTAWAEYCKILESDPWGKPYRTVMKKCKSKGPTNDMPIDMVKAVLQRLFTMGHGPPPFTRAAKRQRPKKKEISASASPSAKAMSSMPPEEWTPRRLQEPMACRARSRSW